MNRLEPLESDESCNTGEMLYINFDQTESKTYIEACLRILAHKNYLGAYNYHEIISLFYIEDKSPEELEELARIKKIVLNEFFNKDKLLIRDINIKVVEDFFTMLEKIGKNDNNMTCSEEIQYNKERCNKLILDVSKIDSKFFSDNFNFEDPTNLEIIKQLSKDQIYEISESLIEEEEGVSKIISILKITNFENDTNYYRKYYKLFTIKDNVNLDDKDSPVMNFFINDTDVGSVYDFPDDTALEQDGLIIDCLYFICIHDMGKELLIKNFSGNEARITNVWGWTGSNKNKKIQIVLDYFSQKNKNH